jgi:xanthine dehydrogenase accessory factor
LSVDVLQRDLTWASGSASAYKENVIPDLQVWTAEGQRCALVTLVGVDGNAPRAEGAQMAVSETGSWSGYLSGGCLEQAIALEAMEAIKAQTPRLLRYGKGSPYFDIRLPCGSGLDIFIQPIERRLVSDISALSINRRPFQLSIDLNTGNSTLMEFESEPGVRSQRQGDTFLCVFTPTIRCLILGSSPIGASLAELAACAGFEADFFAPDPETLPPLPAEVRTHALAGRPPLQTDPWTAAILTFHDHEQELPIFRELLRSECFFISAIGSTKAHEARKLALAEDGFSNTDIARIESPAGLVQHLKTAPFVALSILAQIVAVARSRSIVS